MKLTVNGDGMELADSSTVEVLLQKLEINKESIAVAVNERVVTRKKHSDTVLNDGDVVEVIRAIGGG